MHDGLSMTPFKLSSNTLSMTQNSKMHDGLYIYEYVQPTWDGINEMDKSNKWRKDKKLSYF